ncbi:UDP-glucuronosyltransferase 2C1-like [Zootermopsis nevadensis]|uniref:UDP-glucuronosyltransferase 2B31 n=1 Tax=Zootermopsis nevadensis TaxID=136037 RepID=A0A067QM86_ZOONE|nr:UDP-glucuronosyltransferase 2C1-like [Zootermopsis nevadensis]XP_021936747.1 UDP-glucuronosyltransferase 2C1-like [Zootermopsis nevadensis]KDR10226.1 UDP-glucuronosyltransferase 2B31 [Zootermopsis nevadensis]
MSSVVRLLALLLMCYGLYEVQSAKILALLNLALPSHYIFNRALLIELAGRGHQVTVISPDREKLPVPNLHSIQLEGIYNTIEKNVNYESFAEMSLWDFTFAMFDWGTDLCKRELQTEGARKLLNYPSTERFDLIITEIAWGECFFAFIHKFGSPPVIATSGVGIPPWISLTMRNPENPSYMPNFMLPFSSHMTFRERMLNFIIHNFVTLIYEYRYIRAEEAIARKYFKDFPPFWDIERNFSIVLVNTVPGVDDPRPLLPNVIPVGGMHIKDVPSPLPKDLQTYLDEAKEGFIFFSLGSNLRSDSLSYEKMQALLEAFSELPQRILWKFESDNLPGQPPNVRTGKWLPQSDILAHPNIRVFISHCGKMSSIEASYRGVPVVGIPFFLDQRLNLRDLVNKGVGVELDYKSITKENILAALREVLNNDSYRINMKKRSATFKDQPQTALDRAVFWTEYVIRHNGAPHLRSAATDLYWHQYLLLDVLLVLAVGTLLLTMAACFLVRTIYRTIINLTNKSNKKTKTN